MISKFAGKFSLRSGLRKTFSTFTSRECSTTAAQMPAGQPTHYSHPQLLKDEEILPGMRRSEFRRRRSMLVNAISQQSNGDAMILIPSAPDQFLSEKIPRPFRQSSDLLYLSGCQEPGSALVIRAVHPEVHKAVLFVRGADDKKELWDGPRFYTTEATADFFGVDLVLPADKLGDYLYAALGDNEKRMTNVWFDKIFGQAHDGSPRSTMDTVIANNISSIKLDSTRPLLHQLRVIKSLAEIELMRKTCQIGADAVAETIAQENYLKHKDVVEESSIAARVEFECRRRGAQHLGYPPVVATGTRTNTIHYVANNNIGAPGDLALMDAGCEYYGYNSDITRTWPLSGSFSGPQRVVYEAVLDVQQKLIKLLDTSRPTLSQLFAEMCRLLGANLKEIGLLPKSVSGNELLSGAHSFCPHHVSHFLGMDIHDTPSISHSLPLQSGMVITIEPGVYIRSDRKDVPAEFRGIGIRIEDDVLITNSGCEVLSAGCPKDVAALEKLMQRSSMSS
ncbi:Hypothetical predicted protein [Cloeon dipterum]|uniref:Aminopeptidase P N-terminal domain-containing protein n=1 Tax=Cloeon dipterum TaxID=197152 RepID=A0A8S1CHW0_9INSE|nr:Hypothetical predicted protein [Cloeon dipterum]